MSALHPLTQEVAHPSPGKKRISPITLWSGLLLAPLAFSVQVICSYPVASDLCARGGSPLAWLIAINVATVLVAAAGVIAAWISWRHTRAEKAGGAEATAERGDGRTRFLAQFGMISSALLLFAVLMQLTSLVFFGPCSGFGLLR